MNNQKFVSYEDLEVRIDHKPNKDGINVQETLQRLDFRKDPKASLVPTEDAEVRRTLLLLKEPEFKGGEDEFSRRERLIELLVANRNYMEIFEKSLVKDLEEEEEEEESEEDEEDFYTPAGEGLKKARKFLIQYSIDQAKKRLDKHREEAHLFDIPREIKNRRALAHRLTRLELAGSQVTSLRPISSVKLSSDDSVLAIGSWDGSVKTISADSLQVTNSIDGAHHGKVGEVDWSPKSDFLATGGEDGLARLYAVSSEGLRHLTDMRGHERRIAGCKFHPSGKYIATASFDTTWRLWDIDTGEELLLQEGHGKEVFCLAFQSDGSLLCSGGLDSTGIVWDIRSGKCAMVLSGHTKPIYSVDWSPRGHELATGSGDGTVNIWDIRKASQPQVLLAHNSIVSGVKFEKSNGKVLMSCGYDKLIKAYSSDNWNNTATLHGHTDKILSLDMGRDCEFVVSAGWDRSVKSWKIDS